jgi:glucose-1-phosphate cytidylyltransferase
MKVVILAGGLGTRLAEETDVRPKPMVEIGGFPMLWHIMQIYDHYGFDDFIVALGYKGSVIKQHFLAYQSTSSDVTIDFAKNQVSYDNAPQIKWRLQMIDTGNATLTGGRIKRLEGDLREHGTFMATYGDGLANLDIREVLNFHRSHGRIATLTAVRPPARFGTMIFDGQKVTDFSEKPQTGEGWINGGFFVFEPEIFDYLENDQTILETKPLESLAADGQLMAYKHDGFWQCMDTLRDKIRLQEMWSDGKAAWKVW